jgi:hypothetical protein
MAMKAIGIIGKGLFLLMVMGFMGTAIPASAEASERVVVRTERRWVQPVYETRYYQGYPQTVIVREGYWDTVPVYGDTVVIEPAYTYSYSSPYYYSYPYYYSGYPYYYSRYYGPSVNFDFRFGGGHHHHRR